VTYSYPLTENQFGMHTTGSICAARDSVHFRDEASKPEVSNSPSRRSSRSPGVVAGLRDCEDSARNLYRQSFVGHYRHRCVSPFGRTTSFFISSVARLVTASSASSSAILFRAAASSALSVLESPGF
jgi:hypothetical protein